MELWNPFDEFDPFTFEMPLTARSLCALAAEFARDQLNELDKGALSSIMREYIELIIEQQKTTGVDIASITPPNMHDLFEFDSDTTHLNTFMEEMHLLPGSNSPIEQRLKNLSDEDFLVMKCLFLLLHIASLKSVETELMSNTEETYESIAIKLDPLVLDVHNTFSIIQRLPQGLKYLETKSKQAVRAQKGGKGKGAKSADLKELVLEKASSLHAHLSAAKAAREIHQNIEAFWLQDENGKDLFEDPVGRFCEWIRADRRMTKA